MFCIAAFIVLAICGIFSGAYRQMAKKAWHCVLRRVTFRPCDINFSEEVKGKLLGRMILIHPGLARFCDRWIDTFAWVLVGLSVWSLASVSMSGLNLLIYDTCNPAHAESCTLSGEACSVGTYQPGLFEATRQGKPQTWFVNEGENFVETVSLIPARFHEWKPDEYVSSDNSWYYPYDPAKPSALEIVDPGCPACAHLFANIREAGFEKRYNLTYVAFPIPDAKSWSGYKFMNSYLIASWLEAMKQVKPAKASSEVAPDWRLIERIFTGSNAAGDRWQQLFDLRFDPDQARDVLAGFARDFGYSGVQTAEIAHIAESADTAARIQVQKRLVGERIHTVKIPTILFGGRRYDRVVPTERLR